MQRTTRRSFLRATAGAVAASTAIPYFFTAQAEEHARPRSQNDRFRIAAIGMRYQGTVITELAAPYGDLVAIADVDREVGEEAVEHFGGKATLYEDYRQMLDKEKIDVLLIGAPDHWHVKMCLDAARAGVDIFCEKPLTLTVDEGKRLCKVIAETGCVCQVGSWQRSDHRFRLACEMVRSGRIGELREIEVVLGKNQAGGPFAVEDPPPHLNWDLWQGQTPDVPYIKERSHYTFRWWYEYSGGQMTDWGTHHIDIAQWAAGAERSGPVEVYGTAKMPEVTNGYNVATDFEARYVYPNGVTMTVLDHGRNGVMLTGTEGRIFVNRGTLAGRPVEDLADAPLEREDFRLYAHDNLNRPPRMGKIDSTVNHMGNFFDCVRTRNTPVSDVVSQHRSATTCHLGNIAMHLGRPLRWDPERERFVDDDEANRWLSRPQRAGYETV